MNITETFRRKNHYHKPILVFKELYRDYYKQSSPFKYHNPNVVKSTSDMGKFKTLSYENQLIDNESRPVSKLQKTRSAQQFSQYLTKYGNTPSQLSLKTLDQPIQTMKTIQKTRNKTLMVKSFDKTRFQENDDSKRSYFKNNYTQSHPFFEKNKNFMKQKRIDLKQNQTLPILPEIFKQSDETIKKPIQKRIQMQQLKNRFIERKQKAVDKFSKLRYNFLVKKVYRQQQQESRTSTNIKQNLKNSFQTTKQNIFPESFM